MNQGFNLHRFSQIKRQGKKIFAQSRRVAKKRNKKIFKLGGLIDSLPIGPLFFLLTFSSDK